MYGGMYGNVAQCMAMYCYAWICSVVYGYVGLCMATHGYVRLYGRAALQAATTLVAMASKKNIWQQKLTKVANWRPTDYERNLLGKLNDVWSNYQK